MLDEDKETIYPTELLVILFFICLICLGVLIYG